MLQDLKADGLDISKERLEWTWRLLHVAEMDWMRPFWANGSSYTEERPQWQQWLEELENLCVDTLAEVWKLV